MGTLVKSISLQPASGTSFVNITTTPASGTNTILSDFGTLASGMQVEWDNTSGISISNDGTVTRSGTGSVTFSYRVWQGEGAGWSAGQSFDFVGLSLTGQGLSLSYGEILVDSGGVYVALSGQPLSADQGTLGYLFDQYLTVAGQEVIAGQGAVTVGVGEAIVVVMSGQAIFAQGGLLSIQHGTSETVALLGQSAAYATGTLGYYISEVAVALNGQPMSISQAALVKVSGTLVDTTWTPDVSGSSVWTPETPAGLSWTPEGGSVNTWFKEGL